ncbi:hypothetical protein AGMMS49941_10900 [Deferribacterales bacterium]|nr:hypothetical protein AGMMS49941_10900 [Deferribacterales bacterium]
MASESKISVIIPMYNAERYIAQCLENIIYQSHKNLEIIIVDDGSIDNSKDVCDGYASRDSRIKIIAQANQGVASARNKGIDSANGQYIHFMDADDYIYDLDYYEMMLETALMTDAAIVRSGMFDERSGDIQMASAHRYVLTGGVSNLYGGVVWAALFRRDFIKKHQLRFLGRFSQFEDTMFSWEAAICTERTAVCPRVLVFHRYVQGSLSTGLDEHNRLKIRQAYNEELDALELKYNVKIPRMEKVRERPVITKYRLFSTIVVIKKEKYSWKTRYLLFGVIPILTIRGR